MGSLYTDRGETRSCLNHRSSDRSWEFTASRLLELVRDLFQVLPQDYLVTVISTEDVFHTCCSASTRSADINTTEDITAGCYTIAEIMSTKDVGRACYTITIVVSTKDVGRAGETITVVLTTKYISRAGDTVAKVLTTKDIC